MQSLEIYKRMDLNISLEPWNTDIVVYIQRKNSVVQKATYFLVLAMQNLTPEIMNPIHLISIHE